MAMMQIRIVPRARESTPRGDEHDNEARPADQRAHGHVDVYHRIDLVMGNRLGFYPRHGVTTPKGQNCTLSFTKLLRRP